MSGGYINAVFDNVSISSKTAHMLAAASMPSVVMSSAGTTQMLLPAIISDDIKLEKIFGSIYRFDIPNGDKFKQPTKGIIIFGSEKSAILIINSVFTSPTNTVVELNAMFYLAKQSGDDTSTIKALNGSSVWSADIGENYTDQTGGILYSADIAKVTPFVPLTMSKDAPFEVSLDVDLLNTKITVSADGDFIVGDNASSVNVNNLLKGLTKSDTMTLPVKRAGYNTLYAATEKSKFVVVLDDADTAHIFAEICPTGDKQSEVCSLAGLMKKKTQ